jgi:hypothetical protein
MEYATKSGDNPQLIAKTVLVVSCKGTHIAEIHEDKE